MKNQNHISWKWHGLLVVSFFLCQVANNAFAAGRDCKNPSYLVLAQQVKMKFCDIPAAKGVLIGSENSEKDEKPVRARNFMPFQIGQFEVTQLQYKTVTGTEPWKYGASVKEGVREGDNNPASGISYNDAIKFISYLNQLDKTAVYRLPTEAEFEYAARAGTTTKYFWGDLMDDNYAYSYDNTRYRGLWGREVDSCPNPTMSKYNPGYCANNFGLYHMLGNVEEFTADAYAPDSYAHAPRDGNLAVEGNTTSSRVLRGGSIGVADKALTSSWRDYSFPDFSTFYYGFRIVRTVRQENVVRRNSQPFNNRIPEVGEQRTNN